MKTTDHKEIKSWAESRDMVPARVAETDGNSGGVIRLMKPQLKSSESDYLEKIPWDDWFQVFEEQDLALVHEDDSNFNKLVSR